MNSILSLQKLFVSKQEVSAFCASGISLAVC